MMRLIGVVCILFVLAAPVAAQDTACNIDLSSTVSLLVQAQAQASSGNADTALLYIAQAQAKLDAFQSVCGVAVIDDEPVVDVALTQSFTIEDRFDGDMTFSYPEGWAQGEDGGILIATDAAILDRDFGTEPPPFFPGEALIFIDFGRPQDFSRTGAQPPLELVTELSQQIPSSFGPLTAPVSLTVNDLPAALFTVTGARAHLIVMSAAIGDIEGEPVLAQFILLAAPGELEMFEPVLMAVAESIEYQEPS